MNTEIYDEGTCLRLVLGGNTLIVTKNQIKTVDTLKGNTIRLDIGEGALKNIYINAADVTVPANLGGRITDVYAAVKNMLKTTGIAVGGGGGNATAANQDTHTMHLQNISDALTDLKVILNSQNEYNNPSRVDESVPAMVYHGFAMAGEKPEDPSWAIRRVKREGDMYIYEWADGDTVRDNVWDDRYTLTYLPLPPQG